MGVNTTQTEKREEVSLGKIPIELWRELSKQAELNRRSLIKEVIVRLELSLVPNRESVNNEQQ